MPTFAKDCKSTVIPAVRYRDCHAAIDWLVRALGFEKQAVYDAPDGSVAHAQLTFGNGMVMLGTVKDDAEWNKWMAQPDEVGGRETITTCLIVADAAAIYASAKAAGAEMIRDLETMEYGGKAFACKDPEGHLWSIGEYDPWA